MSCFPPYKEVDLLYLALSIMLSWFNYVSVLLMLVHSEFILQDLIALVLGVTSFLPVSIILVEFNAG